MIRAWSTIFLCCIATIMAWSQGSTPWEQQGAIPITDSVEAPALEYTYYTIDALDSSFQYVDTTLALQAQHYDPIQRRRDYYINLGNNGSAHKPLIYRKTVEPLIDFGHHEYDLYRIEFPDLRLYQTNRPIADLAYSSLGGRQNFVVSADFSRGFTDGIHTNVQYRRFIQEGFYQDQNIRNTNLGLSFTYSGKYDKYRLVVALLNNVASSLQNGGITNVNLNEQAFANRLNVPTQLSDASTRYQERGFSALQRYRLDWRRNGFDVSAEHRLALTGGYFRFQDNDVSRAQDSTFYDGYLTDSRGIRLDNDFTRVSNRFDLVGRKGDEGIEVRLGIQHGYTSFRRAPGKESINDILLRGSATLPWRGQALDASGWLGVGSAGGTFNVSGTLSIVPVDGLLLDANLQLYRHRPSLLQSELVLTQEIIWQNNFGLPAGTVLGGKLRVPAWNLQVDLTQTAETNSIYYGTVSIPEQWGDVYSATVLSASHGLRLGRFGLDNTAHLQVFSENLYRLPTWTTRHDLWWDGYVFRGAMHTRIGVEATIIPSHAGSALMPVTGVFYQASGFEVQDFILVEPYLTMQISKFRAFLKFENFTNNFSTRLPIYVEDYPQFDARFRLGVRWLLMD